ncbi:Tim44/TimA family putative adaptor protein [Pseudoxanthobacter sp. M-2]|uniref:Tim44/TimA family putative adaptor protein n=1 Tax=Pseudoxanthobacter sp. M-2 TaxID=3078754 RepID=UPI0038FC587E
MNELFDIYNIIFLVLAVAVFLRLRSVLGRRTGNERQPVDPYQARDNADASGATRPDNVVSLPSAKQPGELSSEQSAEAAERIARIAPAGSSLNEQLTAIVASDPSFDPEHFVTGARAAYEMIVTAFAEGDRKNLKPLLSREVFEGFDTAIADRESRGEKVESTFVGIEKAEIVDASLKGPTAHVTVRFRSELISLTRGRDGTVVEGDANKVVEVVDIWTFARDISSRDPNWKLVATESAD